MKNQFVHCIAAMMIAAVLLGCSKGKETIGQPIDPQAKVVRLQEVLSNPQAYDGQTLVIEGNFSGACCASDFIFKDGVASTEVLVSKECPMPSTKAGSRMKVWGTVSVKVEAHEEAGEASESRAGEAAEQKGQAAEKGAEVRIAAKGIEVI